MKLGNFFDVAPGAAPQPVNPRVIVIKLVCEESTLPNGQSNPSGRPVRGHGKAALVMMGGKAVIQSRVKSRQLLAELVAPMRENENAPPPRTNDGDESIALMYQQVSQVVREWDEANQIVGPPLFPSADIAIQLVTFEEANRIMGEYAKYMSDEHPTEVDPATRTKSQGRSVRPSAGPPR